MRTRTRNPTKMTMTSQPPNHNANFIFKGDATREMNVNLNTGNHVTTTTRTDDANLVKNADLLTSTKTNGTEVVTTIYYLNS